ncbi:MAG: hypothetical protein WC455_21740 [Dehalococcoidia bacterium]
MMKKTDCNVKSFAVQSDGSDTIVSIYKPKKVSMPLRFCTWCRPADPLEKNHDFHVFIDRKGRGWRCAIPYQCDHAIILDGSIHSCRILTSILNSEEREAGTIVGELCDRIAAGEAVVVAGRL